MAKTAVVTKVSEREAEPQAEKPTEVYTGRIYSWTNEEGKDENVVIDDVYSSGTMLKYYVYAEGENQIHYITKDKFLERVRHEVV